MDDFDLIPNDYKYWQWQRNWLKLTALILLLGMISVLVASVYFYSSNLQVNESARDLQRQIAITEIQQNQLQSLLERKIEIQGQWDLLNGLRGGTSVKTILATIDRSLSQGEVWFLDWQFQRVSQKIDSQSSEQQNEYVFIVSDNVNGQPESWKIDTHISINGQARDHSAFTSFVQKLIISDGIVDVKIVKTDLNKLNDINIVDFNILVMIENIPGISDA